MSIRRRIRRRNVGEAGLTMSAELKCFMLKPRPATTAMIANAGAAEVPVLESEAEALE